jgi:DNA-binding transcriptional MerR regulator
MGDMMVLLEPGKVAEILGVTKERVRQLAMSGVLVPAEKRGRVRLYSPENVWQVAEARDAGEGVKRRAKEAGVLTGDLARRVEMRELRQIARANHQVAIDRARKRCDEMRRRLDELEVIRRLNREELAAVEGETEYLRGAIDRLSIELSAVTNDR